MWIHRHWYLRDVSATISELKEGVIVCDVALQQVFLWSFSCVSYLILKDYFLILFSHRGQVWLEILPTFDILQKCGFHLTRAVSRSISRDGRATATCTRCQIRKWQKQRKNQKGKIIGRGWFPKLRNLLKCFLQKCNQSCAVSHKREIK